MYSFLSILGPFRRYVLLLFVIMLIAALFEAIGLGLIIPFLGIVLGEGAIAGSSNAILYFNDVLSRLVPRNLMLIGICAIILAVFLIKNVFVYLKSVLTVYLYNSLREYWSSGIMDKYIHAEYDYIISQKRGTLINNLINEPMLASKFIGQLADYLSRVIIALSIYGIMLLANWRVTLALSVIAGILLGFFWKMSTRFSTFVGEKRLKLNQEITAEGEQSLNGIRQVKLFSLENTVYKNFSKKFNELKKMLVRLDVFKSLPVPTSETLIVLFLVLTLLYFEYYWWNKL